MTITDRATLEGLRLSCLDQLAKGNRRMATIQETIDILARIEDSGYTPSWGLKAATDLKAKALFKCLDYWLILAIDPRSPWERIAAGIAVDILSKEEEDARKTD